MNNEERLERLNVILDDLSEMCASRVLLVEGPKDRMAMTLLGINAEMMSVQSEGGPLRAAEKLYEERRSAVIMTDWDRAGDEIANDLERSLSSLCVKHDATIRSKLRWICGNEIYDVESLPSFYCRLVTESVRRNEGKNK
jgi:5S rRNA maturation endonuclease (ribonuclease M5)